MIFMAHRLILGLLLNCVEDSRIPRATDVGGAISVRSAETVRSSAAVGNRYIVGNEVRLVSALFREMAPPRRKQNFWQQMLKYIVKRLLIWGADQEHEKYDIHGAEINSWAVFLKCVEDSRNPGASDVN
ncbi:unnamed protein product [Xylocopa violacea]|uniref:Uncharacterized protein n=1 Tax=Xylocopa violacea TaxID=135666 RepID=A0ABP1P2S5_XYLVO